MKSLRRWLVAGILTLSLLMTSSAWAQEAAAESSSTPPGVELGVVLVGAAIVGIVGTYLALSGREDDESQK